MKSEQTPASGVLKRKCREQVERRLPVANQRESKYLFPFYAKRAFPNKELLLDEVLGKWYWGCKKYYSVSFRRTDGARSTVIRLKGIWQISWVRTASCLGSLIPHTASNPLPTPGALRPSPAPFLFPSKPNAVSSKIVNFLQRWPIWGRHLQL